jgi:DNA repair protein RadD
MTMQFRPRQQAAIQSLWDYFDRYGGNPIVAMPPGTGKSVVIGGFAYSMLYHYPRTRVLMCTHVQELIEQNFARLLDIWPTAPAGIYAASLNRKEIAAITYGSIQSLYKRARELGHIDIMMVDESHLVNNADNTMYMQLITELKLINPYLKVVGFSATPYRMATGLLTDSGIFNDCCFDDTTLENFNHYIREGWLCRLVSKPTATELDVSGVGLLGNEYNQGALEAAVDREEVTRAALHETVQNAGDRKHWLVFGTGTNHCHHIADILADFGVSAAVVHHKTPPDERRKLIAHFKAGQVTALVNNNLLTTGFDFPGIDLIVCLRPTRSPGLWVQMLGRGIRPVYMPFAPLDTAERRLYAIAAGPKPSCRVFDFAGNAKRLGPINDPRIPERKRKGGGGGTAPIKFCPKCLTQNHASVRFCEECEYEFPHVNNLLQQHAADAEFIREDEPVVADFAVSRVVYNQHKNKKGGLTLRVTYHCGLRRFNEYVPIEHSGNAKALSTDWWRKCSGKPAISVPGTVADAILRLHELRTPHTISVWINRTHPQIMKRQYAD